MGAGSHRGTILYRNAELVRGLQFYIERRALVGLQFYFFACLEVVGAGNVWVTPYNSVRDYPRYNSKLGYNSSFFVFEVCGGGECEGYYPLQPCEELSGVQF